MSGEEVEALWFPLSTPNGSVRASPKWLEIEMNRYNEIQKTSAEKLGGIFVDLDSMFPKNLKMYFDDCHFTDAGSEYIAQLVMPALKNKVKSVIEAHKS